MAWCTHSEKAIAGTNEESVVFVILPTMTQQGLTLSIWFTCSSGTWFWKFTCSAKIFTCPANICTSPVKLMYIPGKISTCPDWKITCPVGHVTTKFYVPWDTGAQRSQAGMGAGSQSTISDYSVFLFTKLICRRWDISWPCLSESVE